jgi:hypothetical protein
MIEDKRRNTELVCFWDSSKYLMLSSVVIATESNEPGFDIQLKVILNTVVCDTSFQKVDVLN